MAWRLKSFIECLAIIIYFIVHNSYLGRDGSMQFQREFANVPIFGFITYILLPLVFTHVPAWFFTFIVTYV